MKSVRGGTKSSEAAVRGGPAARGSRLEPAPAPPDAAPTARATLVNRLLASREPVVTVVAPPGYGKTALLTEWAERQEHHVGWVSCELVQDDPVALWTAVVAALGLVEPRGVGSTELITRDTGRLIRHLTDLLGALRQPVAIVLDELEALTSRDAQRLVAALSVVVPTGSRLAVASREQMPFALARMRVQRRVLEIGAVDLALSRTEASLLVRAAGVDVSEEAKDRLVRETEGWPAALYLAVRAVQTGDTPADVAITGDNLLMREYLQSEVLQQTPQTQVDFLVRTSILDRVNGELGGAVAGGGDAGRLLDRLQRRNLLVVPVDGKGEWYRYHELFRAMLNAELRRGSPELVPELHARAAEWFEAAGDLESAIEHAHLAGDAGRFGRLVLEAMQPVWASGRVSVVAAWMERLGHRSPAAHTPAMIAHGALTFALLGHTGDAERWVSVAEALPATGTLTDGSSVAATMAYLRANLCRDGSVTMRRDSAAAFEGLSPASPYRATMLHTQGLSYLLEGDLENADAFFAHAYDLAVSYDTPPLAALVLAEQCLVAIERDDWIAADAFARRSHEIIASGPYDGYWSSALVNAVAAHTAAHRGDAREAGQYLARATRLRPLLTYALPVVSVQTLLELAHAHFALNDTAGVTAVLDQVRGILRQRPDLGSLVEAAHRLEERLGRIASIPRQGGSALTTAELRLVPLLPTQLTMPEIGARLFISRNTVKTQVGSLYRKLGVTSRSQAVDRLVDLGLV